MRRALVALVLAFLAGLAFALLPARQRQTGPLVLAAASLQEAMQAAADAWQAQGHPRPVLSFAASSALARQIVAGARADLFVSADNEWMDELAARDLIRPESRTNLVGNALVLIAPAGDRVDLAVAKGFPLGAALGPGRLAMADPQAVPAGRYAKQALSSLGVWDAVADRIAPAENVRAALALVSRGEAPLGIVYATDAAAEPGVRIVSAFPESSHLPITYPMALLKTSGHRDAEAFRRFLLSPQAAAIFRRFGFDTAVER